jgi:acyl-CoA synthetase (AMP-forming)/AMP-acid ligase II
MIISSGVMWTAEVKEQLLDRIQQVVLLDAIGSTEGSMGMQISMRGMPIETAKFAQMPDTKVFTDDDRLVEPGSDEIGMVAAGGNVPLGYWKDPEEVEEAVERVDGVRGTRRLQGGPRVHPRRRRELRPGQLKRRRRRLLVTTNTLEKAMAAPAMSGVSRPTTASGIAAVL